MLVTITGASMRPGLPPGARVRVDVEDRAAVPGRVVLLEGGEGWIVHRVLAVAGEGPAARFAHAGDGAWRFGLAAPAQVGGRVVESVGPLEARVLAVRELPLATRLRYAVVRLAAIAALAGRATLTRG